MIDDTDLYKNEIKFINEKYQYLMDNATSEVERKEYNAEMLKEEDVLLRLVHPSVNP